MTTATLPSTTAVSGTVSPRDAARLADGGQAWIVDVREPDEHRREHVAGAALHPSSAFSVTGFPAATPGRRVLVLCRSGNRAGKVAAALRSAGRNDVDVIEGGITAWMAQGLPVVRNAKAPLPIIRQVMIAAGAMQLGFTIAAAATGNPWWLVGTGFVGAGLFFAGASGICPMATVLGKMPWNRTSGGTALAPAAKTCATSGSGCGCG
jgi:rhodanese-related sulfurtransferase